MGGGVFAVGFVCLVWFGCFRGLLGLSRLGAHLALPAVGPLQGVSEWLFSPVWLALFFSLTRLLEYVPPSGAVWGWFLGFCLLVWFWFGA